MTASDITNQCKQILKQLKSLGNPAAAEGMARYSINVESAYGVSIPNLREIARKTGKNRPLAEALWASRIHEARILAGMVYPPGDISDRQMETWANDFDSWDLCDQCCNNLFRKATNARTKAVEWSVGNEEFVKRAGFVLIACLAVHDKQATDSEFVKFLPIIKREAVDQRNFVKKAVNWALRQIGKRNRGLNHAAIATADEIKEIDSAAAKWIAADAIRELASDAVQKRLHLLASQRDV
ncbi:MAG: DNA alkylation repair protein [Desulfomonilaceae bacterium]